MAVGRVDDQHIDARIDQPLGAFAAGVTYAGRRRHQEAFLLVLGGERMIRRFLHVVNGDEAHALAVIIHHEKFFDPVLVEKAPGLGTVNAFLHGHELPRHQIRHLGVHVGGKAHIAVGDDAFQLAAVIDHGNAGNLARLLDGEKLADGGVRRNGDGVHHHAAFIALHLGHMFGLGGGLQVLVNDAKAAGLRHGDRHGRFRHRVHGRRHDGNGEFDVAGEFRFGGDIRGQHGRRAGLHQHVVKGEIFGKGTGHHVNLGSGACRGANGGGIRRVDGCP